MANIIHVTTENIEQDIIKSDKPVIVDAYAEWCGPCQQMAPVFEELAKEHGNTYGFGKLNIDEARDIAIQLGIMSVPTFLFFKNGDLVGQEVGYMTKEDLIDHMKKYLA